MPRSHVRRVCWPVGAGAKEPIVVVRVDVMRLNHPHEMHRIGTAGKAAIGVMNVVADRLVQASPSALTRTVPARYCASDMRYGTAPASLLPRGGAASTASTAASMLT